MGCNACTVICKQHNATVPGVFWNKVITAETGKYPNSKVTFLPALCMHCENPPCVKACPTGATHQQENGIVLVDSEKCIGCRMCMVACPYSARTFNYGQQKSYFEGQEPTAYEQARTIEHVAGTVAKCKCGKERVEAREDPMCVSVCPTHARTFGDLDDPNSEVSKLVASRGAYQLEAELGTNPSIFYIPG